MIHKRFFPHLTLAIVASCLYLFGFSDSLFWDDQYVFFDENKGISAVTNPVNFWIHATQYSRTWPLSFTTLWCLLHLFGKNFFLYKIFNLLLHLANAFLLYQLMKKIRFSHPLVIALIFLIHPYHVETISWVFQLKTILSTFFFLLCYHFFFDCIRQKKISLYLVSLLFFLLSLLAKSTAIFMPLLFLFHLPTQKKKWFSLLIVPFLILSLWQGVKSWDGVATNRSEMSAYAQEHASFDDESIVKKTQEILAPSPKNVIKIPTQKRSKELVILSNFSFYFSNFFFPRKNLSTYPQLTSKQNALNYIFIATFILLLAILFFINPKEAKKGHYSLLFYTLAILPVLGFIYIPYMKFSDVADHWAYLATIPLSILLISIWDFCIKSSSKRSLKTGATLLLLFVCFQFLYNTFTYVHIFNDSNKEAARMMEHNDEVQFIPLLPGIKFPSSTD